MVITDKSNIAQESVKESMENTVKLEENFNKEIELLKAKLNKSNFMYLQEKKRANELEKKVEKVQLDLDQSIGHRATLNTVLHTQHDANCERRRNQISMKRVTTNNLLNFLEDRRQSYMDTMEKNRQLEALDSAKTKEINTLKAKLEQYEGKAPTEKENSTTGAVKPVVARNNSPFKDVATLSISQQLSSPIILSVSTREKKIKKRLRLRAKKRALAKNKLVVNKRIPGSIRAIAQKKETVLNQETFSSGKALSIEAPLGVEAPVSVQAAVSVEAHLNVEAPLSVQAPLYVQTSVASVELSSSTKVDSVSTQEEAVNTKNICENTPPSTYDTTPKEQSSYGILASSSNTRASSSTAALAEKRFTNNQRPLGGILTNSNSLSNKNIFKTDKGSLMMKDARNNFTPSSLNTGLDLKVNKRFFPKDEENNVIVQKKHRVYC